MLTTGAALLAVMATAGAAAPADQSPPAGPPTAEPRTWTVHFDLGGRKLERKDGSYPLGFEPATGVAEVVVGYRWRPRWVSEASLGWTSDRRDTFEQEFLDQPAGFSRVRLQHDYRVVRLTVAQIYEFGSSVVRPLAGIGVGLDLDRGRDRRIDLVSAPLTDLERQNYAESGIVLTSVDRYPCLPVTNQRGDRCALPNAETSRTHAFPFALVGVRVQPWRRAFLSVSVRLGAAGTTSVTAGVGWSF